MFLARQGSAFRGHGHHQGNLLKYKAEDDQSFTRWLFAKRGVHTSWDYQNERIFFNFDEFINYQDNCR